jgi:putative membrane protein
MLELSALPGLNAALNALSAACLIAGYALVRRRRLAAHRACMTAAFVCSVLFLISYLFYHSQVGSVRFEGAGRLRATYLGVLLTHSVLAAAVPILAVITLVRALRGRFEKHAVIARWTLPIWLYVSVTGVVVYWMLYHLAT